MEDNEFTPRMYCALTNAWFYMRYIPDEDADDAEWERLRKASDKSFTVENLCKHFDELADQRGVGKQTLDRLSDVAQKHNIEIISKRGNGRRNSYTIPLK